MEDSIKKLTYDTAKVMHPAGKGLLNEGRSADVCICEYDKFCTWVKLSHLFR